MYNHGGRLARLRRLFKPKRFPTPLFPPHRRSLALHRKSRGALPDYIPNRALTNYKAGQKREAWIFTDSFNISRRLFRKARLLTRPTLARRDAPCPMQGRSSAADSRFTFHALRFTVPGSAARTPLAGFINSLLVGDYPGRRQAAETVQPECGRVLVKDADRIWL